MSKRLGFRNIFKRTPCREYSLGLRFSSIRDTLVGNLPKLFFITTYKLKRHGHDDVFALLDRAVIIGKFEVFPGDSVHLPGRRDDRRLIHGISDVPFGLRPLGIHVYWSTHAARKPQLHLESRKPLFHGESGSEEHTSELQ